MPNYCHKNRSLFLAYRLTFIQLALARLLWMLQWRHFFPPIRIGLYFHIKRGTINSPNGFLWTTLSNWLWRSDVQLMFPREFIGGLEL